MQSSVFAFCMLRGLYFLEVSTFPVELYSRPLVSGISPPAPINDDLHTVRNKCLIGVYGLRLHRLRFNSLTCYDFVRVSAFFLGQWWSSSSNFERPKPGLGRLSGCLVCPVSALSNIEIWPGQAGGAKSGKDLSQEFMCSGSGRIASIEMSIAKNWGERNTEDKGEFPASDRHVRRKPRWSSWVSKVTLEPAKSAKLFKSPVRPVNSEHKASNCASKCFNGCTYSKTMSLISLCLLWTRQVDHLTTLAPNPDKDCARARTCKPKIGHWLQRLHGATRGCCFTDSGDWCVWFEDEASGVGSLSKFLSASLMLSCCVSIPRKRLSSIPSLPSPKRVSVSGWEEFLWPRPLFSHLWTWLA